MRDEDVTNIVGKSNVIIGGLKLSSGLNSVSAIFPRSEADATSRAASGFCKLLISTENSKLLIRTLPQHVEGTRKQQLWQCGFQGQFRLGSKNSPLMLGLGQREADGCANSKYRCCKRYSRFNFFGRQRQMLIAV